MGSYLNPGNKGFQESLNSKIYVCQPSATFWKIDGGGYAGRLLCSWRGFG